MKAMHDVVDLATVAATFVDTAGDTLDVGAWLRRVLQGVQSCLHQFGKTFVFTLTPGLVTVDLGEISNRREKNSISRQVKRVNRA